MDGERKGTETEVSQRGLVSAGMERHGTCALIPPAGISLGFRGKVIIAAQFQVNSTHEVQGRSLPVMCGEDLVRSSDEQSREVEGSALTSRQRALESLRRAAPGFTEDVSCTAHRISQS